MVLDNSMRASLCWLGTGTGTVGAWALVGVGAWKVQWLLQGLMLVGLLHALGQPCRVGLLCAGV
jgi:hypothetical protein